MITLKLATSLDGRIATAQGESRWITGPEAREQVHRLRSTHDAVLIGVGTALADDPELTVRLPAYDGPQPARIVLDSHQRLPLTSRLALSARDIPTYLVSLAPLHPAQARLGVRGVGVRADDAGRPDLTTALAALGELGLHRLFVEGGGETAASFMRHGRVTRLEWFRAPIILGGDGRPAIAALSLDALADAPRLRRTEVRVLGEDLWESYERI
jgi:diaminohydroxyphosphoribosylaminopyrimidine deaminase/5-amino-6-(5-phosphoribosylamino)uracil reductase